MNSCDIVRFWVMSGYFYFDAEIGYGLDDDPPVNL